MTCRRTSKEGPDGMPVEAVRPYLMDLGSTNGTFINSEQLDAQRYYELLEQVPSPPHRTLPHHLFRNTPTLQNFVACSCLHQ
jgi:pSer/pThr/pTyr-binding forkhead associated (FHA) protein